MPDNFANGRRILLQEFCVYHGVKRHTGMRWIELRNKFASKVSRLCRFNPVEVDEWVRSGSVSERQDVSE